MRNYSRRSAMDESFMSQVAERLAAATEAVSSCSPTSDTLPAVQTMEEWMASHSPGAKFRCADCKAPLLEGSTTICIACGCQLPPPLAVKRKPFSFDKSLAKSLFYESVHLQGGQEDVQLPWHKFFLSQERAARDIGGAESS